MTELQTNLTNASIRRNLRMSQKRPQAPREVAFKDNLLTWLAPQDDSGVAHYRIRIDRDIGDPDFEVSAGQRSVQLFKGETFVVSSYNNINDLESQRVGIGAGYGENSNIKIGETAGIQGSITFSSVDVALSDPNDFGLRFWFVKCNYSSNIIGLKSVAAWLEKPTGTPAVKVAESPYISFSSNYVAFALEIPAANTSCRVRLTAITDSAVQPFDGSISYKDFTIGPVPAGTQGVEYCNNVTGQGCTVTTYTDANGLLRGLLNITFTPPADTRWAGVEIDAKKPGPIYEQEAQTSTPGKFSIEWQNGQGTWRIFFRSYDQRGKVNTLNETSSGTPTPYVDVIVGAFSGTLDASKVQAATLSSALSVAAGVLGVSPGGISQTLIADFAISQAKLANAPIIDAVRIIDGAVTNAKIQNLAANKILAGTLAAGVIYAGSLSASQITTGTMSVDFLTGWSGKTINIGSGLTFSPSMTGHQTVIDNSGISSPSLSVGTDIKSPAYKDAYGSNTWIDGVGNGYLKSLTTFSGSIVASTYVQAGTYMASPEYRDGPGYKLLGSRIAGWGAPSGTATRTTFDTATITLEELARRVKALIDDLRTHGLIGN